MKMYSCPEGLATGRRLVATITRSCMVAVLVSLFCCSVATAADLIGTVFKDGKPVIGATVNLVPDSQSVTNSPPPPTKTDQVGQYTIRGIVPGRYKLSCDSMVKIIDIGYGINRYDCKL
jgi:hypothetical protein